MNGGYIKLHRKILESRVFQSEGLLKVFVWCLLKASHKEKWVSIKTGRGTTEVHLLPSQFIFGRKLAAKELKMRGSTVQVRIAKLHKMKSIIVKSITHYSLITIVNWDFYQGKADESINQVSTKYQPSITYKNDKKEKNKIYGQNFLSFWKEYPNKVAKKKAYEAWQKLEKIEDIQGLLPIMLDAIEKQKEAKKASEAINAFTPEWPNPPTWLNGKRWEDEVEIKKRYDEVGF